MGFSIAKEISGAFSGLGETAKGIISQFKLAPDVRVQAELEMKKEINRAEESINAMLIDYEKELTARLKADMMSDSWLSKNVRPLALIFLTVMVTLFAFVTTFKLEATEANIEMLKVWVTLFTALLLTVYGFYFGSRGLEKIMGMIGKAFGKPQ